MPLADPVADDDKETRGLPVLALVGPTASGKTDVAMQLVARRPSVEIVAVDAFTIYRGMDIGTAKPSAQQRAAVAHHLVDLLDPTTDVNVAWFQRAARSAIHDVHARGGIPLLVGGAGLYFQAVVDDLDFPPTDATLRTSLQARWEADPAAAHARLAALDPRAAARIEPGNLRRTVRALEVIELTGRLFSDFATDVTTRQAHYPIMTGVLLDVDRALLRQRIADRAAAMVEAGLVDECQRLRECGDLSATARQGIGYAEAFAVLDGTLAQADLAEAITRRTRAYARRQRAWFQRDPRLAAMNAAAAVDHLVTAIGSTR